MLFYKTKLHVDDCVRFKEKDHGWRFKTHDMVYSVVTPCPCKKCLYLKNNTMRETTNFINFAFEILIFRLSWKIPLHCCQFCVFTTPGIALRHN